MPQPSHGTLILMGDGGEPENFTQITELKDFDWSGFERAVHDASHHTSDWSTVVGGMAKQGSFDFEINYLPGDGTHDELTGLLSLLVSGETRNFKLVYPSPSSKTVTVSGIVTKFEQKSPVDGILTASVSIALNGASGPTW